MALMVHLCFAIVILIGSSLSSVDADYKKYVSLITEIREHYRTSSVLFIFSRNNQRMQEYTMVHLMTRIFSSRSASTLISIFPSLNTRLNSYRKQTGRPLVVVMLRTLDDIVEFDKSVDTLNKSYPIWLVIFRASAGKPFCAYCTNPVGNIFSLRFDTLMLVVCCGNPIVQQWWSVRENQTEFHNFASWRPNEGFNLLEVEQLNARRREVCGTGLRLVILPNSPLIHDYGNDRVGGFFGQVLNELKIAMNFTTKSMRRVETWGSYNSTLKRWSGAVDIIARGECDIGLGDFTITNPRLDVVDFTFPLLISSYQLFIRQPDDSDVQWIAYFDVYSLGTWLTIILLLVTSSFLLAIIKTKRVSVSLLSVSIEKFLNLWGIFCQQGLAQFPAETPLRIAYSSIFASVLVVSAAYSASLISFFTLSSTPLPFTTLEGFTADKSYKLTVCKQSADYDFVSTSNATMALEMMDLMIPLQDLPITGQEAWTQVCNEKVAYYTSLVSKSMTQNIPCNVVGIDTGRVESVALILPANSQYTAVVNYHIGRFKGNGMFERLQNEYYISNKVDASITSYSDVQFSGIIPILSVLVGGILLAFIVLFCEIIYNNGSDGKTRRTQRRFIDSDIKTVIVKKRATTVFSIGN